MREESKKALGLSDRALTVDSFGGKIKFLTFFSLIELSQSNVIGRLSVTTILATFPEPACPWSGSCLCASPTSAIITEHCNDCFSHLSSVSVNVVCT